MVDGVAAARLRPKGMGDGETDVDGDWGVRPTVDCSLGWDRIRR